MDDVYTKEMVQEQEQRDKFTLFKASGGWMSELVTINSTYNQ